MIDSNAKLRSIQMPFCTLAVLDAQQARLLGQQTRNERAISEARNKLSSVTESLNTARNALTRAEQQLTQQKNTP
ncbi:hypothetical protein ACNIZL_28185, partial [Escherichia coli]